MKLKQHKHLLLFVSITVIFISTYMTSQANTLPVSLAYAQKELAKLEISSGGKLGVYAINTANNSSIKYRSQERFPFQSTFKVIGVSAILKMSMIDSNLLQQKITYNKQDLVFWSPITEHHLIEGMTIADLCAATLMYSDNTAINLLMNKLGGPKVVTAFARSINDSAFNLSSKEAELNSNPGNLRDTSTPIAMATSLQQLALGNALAPQQQRRLITWMKNNKTGNARIRAGVPKGWIVADKTGSGDYGITNDIGIIWPPKHAPIVMAIYFIQNKKDAKYREDVVAVATTIILNELM